MSPAARRLATQKLKIIGTPSPISSRSRSKSRTPSIGVRTPGTPGTLILGKNRQSSQNIAKMNIVSTDSQEPVSTDNLLKLPIQRQRASDFFNN